MLYKAFVVMSRTIDSKLPRVLVKLYHFFHAKYFKSI